MSASAASTPDDGYRAESVRVDGRTVHVTLTTGRSFDFPSDRYPRLRAASPSQLKQVTLEARGRGLRWEELDEDLSVPGLVRDFL